MEFDFLRDIITATIASAISSLGMAILGFSQGTDLNPLYYVLLLIIVFTAVLTSVYLKRLPVRGLTIFLILSFNYSLVGGVVWIWSSKTAMASPILQRNMLIFSGVMATLSPIVALKSYSIIFPADRL